MDPAYYLALTTGLIGGFGHCIGMCGPVAAASTVSGSQAPRPASVFVLPHILYNTGRIATYSLIGGFMGLTGSFVNVAGRLAGIQNAAAVVVGLIMIVMGLNITGIWGSTKWIEIHNSSLLRAARRVRASSSSARFVTLGLLLGLLPCGLSYTIFIAAAGTGGFLPGLITALLFGAGTLPALLLFGTLISSLGSVLRGRVYRAGGVLVMIMGIYFMIRGIRLYAGL